MIFSNIVIATKQSYGREKQAPYPVVTSHDYGTYATGLLKSFDYTMVHPSSSSANNHGLPTEVDAYFFDGSVLFCTEANQLMPIHAYGIIFKDYPQENPKEFTLTIEMPVKELLVRNAFDENGMFNVSLATNRERTLSGSVKIVF